MTLKAPTMMVAGVLSKAHEKTNYDNADVFKVRNIYYFILTNK